MGRKLEAVFALNDKASVPAGKISAALVRIGSSVGGGVGASIASFGAKLDGMGKMAEGALKEIKLLGDSGTYLVDLGRSIAEPIFELGKFALEASEAKKRGVASLELVSDAGEDAAATLDRLKVAANMAGKSDEDLLKMYSSLRLMGNSASVAEDQIAAMLDVAAVRGDEGAAALQTLFDKIEAGGKFQVNTKSLAKLGLKQDTINTALKSIERFKHASDAELKSAMDSGRITAEEGASAILQAVSATYDKGEGLGSAAKMLGGNSFEGRVQALKNIVSDLFEDFNAQPLVDALRRIETVLASPAGRDAVKALNDLLADAVKRIGDFATPQNIKGIVRDVGQVAAVVFSLYNAFVGVGEGFMDLMKPAFDVFRDLGLASGSGSGLADVLRALGKVVGWVAAIFVYGVGTILGAIYVIGVGFYQIGVWLWDAAVAVWDGLKWIASGIAWVAGEVWDGLVAAWKYVADFGGKLSSGISAAFDDLVKTLDGWWDTIVGIGKSVVDGIWSGIKSAWRGLIESIKSLVDLLPTAVKKVLGIASPSTVFAEIGQYTMAGMTLGIEREAANTNDAMQGVAEQVAVSGRAEGGGDGASRAASGRGPISITIPISVVAGKGATEAEGRAFGAGLAAALDDQLTDALERAAIEMGALAATG